MAAPLGRRSGSYGCLQSAAAARKPSSKAALPPWPREKEPLLRWFLRSLLRPLLRPHVGMFLLLFFCAAVFIPHFQFSTVYVQRIIFLPAKHFSLPGGFVEVEGEVKGIDLVQPQLASVEKRTGVPSLPVLSLIEAPLDHPCENFSFPPPPPPGSKRTGPRPCPVCYLPVERAMALMPGSLTELPVLKKLEYVAEDLLVTSESNRGSMFGGYPSLQQRNNSFAIRESMTVHCGFVQGKKPGLGTGFDITDADLHEMEQCNGVVVASAIFGNYDVMQQPKNISENTKRSVCFYMFVDEETDAYIKNTTTIDSRKRVGLWRIVVVRNLPYADARRNGKVPKLLLHRIFPNVKYSLWIDGKLELVVDPYQILERFLWRERATFAISRHYKRFDVFAEAEANKAAGKYDNASINYQIEFYKKEGLTPYSSAKLPITSDVPEGCVIIREHVPITNLFTCLWFNEVDRFTSRDQLSFSTVRDKIMSKVDWRVNMFKDCERRNFVIQAYHRDLLEQMHSASSGIQPPPPVLTNKSPRKLSPNFVQDRVPRLPVRKSPVKRGKDRRSSPRRHRSRTTHSRDTISI